jgi:hypothetical protein
LSITSRSPVKKKSLISEDRVLTPRQRMDLRKRQRAEEEAAKIKKAVERNFNEGRKRFNEHRKKQVLQSFFLPFLSHHSFLPSLPLPLSPPLICPSLPPSRHVLYPHGLKSTRMYSVIQNFL